MAAIPLFWNTNMAALTSCENALLVDASFDRELTLFDIPLSRIFKRNERSKHFRLGVRSVGGRTCSRSLLRATGA